MRGCPRSQARRTVIKTTWSTLVVSMLLICMYPPTYAQGVEWEKLNHEVMTLYKYGIYAQALPVARKVLEVAEKAVGPNHLSVAISLDNLSLVCVVLGQHDEAEALYRRALAIWETAKRPNMALALYGLAELYRAQGKEAEAERFYRRALSALDAAVGSEGNLMMFETMPRLLKETGREKLTEEYEKRAAIIRARQQ